MSFPDSTAVIAALNRAAHLVLDPPPFVFEDDVGLRLASVPEVLRNSGYRTDPDGAPRRAGGWLFSPRALETPMRGWRGTMLARARYVEDLLAERLRDGIDQFVILGAGLDTTGLRRPDLLERMRVFEVDEPETQSWKRSRIAELGLPSPSHLVFARVDFEAPVSWVEQLAPVGFARERRCVVASTGVTQYLSEAALEKTMREVASLPSGTTFACTFVLPLASIDPAERELRVGTEAAAAERKAPWISAYEPAQIIALARRSGFATVGDVGHEEWNERYFAGRGDGLRAASGEHMLVATV